MIQFVINEPTNPVPPVNITVEKVGKHVYVKANGVTVLWFTNEGTVMMNSLGSTSGDMEKMGFRMEPDPHNRFEKRVMVR